MHGQTRKSPTRRNLEAESVRSRAESSGGWVNLQTVTELEDGPVHVIHVRFTSTETLRTIRDGEPRTATSIFTQLHCNTFIAEAL